LIVVPVLLIVPPLLFITVVLSQFSSAPLILLVVVQSFVIVFQTLLTSLSKVTSIVSGNNISPVTGSTSIRVSSIRSAFTPIDCTILLPIVVGFVVYSTHPLGHVLA
jgi:hypothetical protein